MANKQDDLQQDLFLLEQQERAARQLADLLTIACDRLARDAGLSRSRMPDSELVQMLKEFSPCIAIDPETAKEWDCDPKELEGDTPLFTEAALYPLLGKDSARDLLGLIERVWERLR